MLIQSWPALGQAPGPAVRVEVSRMHCLVRFVATVAGGRDGYRGTRRVFEQSRFNTPAARRWLRRYRQLDHDPTYQREDYPAGRLGAQASFEPAYLAAAADAADLPDLQRRTVGLLPNEVLVSLDSVYRYFAPAFDTLAWQPHAAELARLREAYSKYLADNKLMQQFGQLRAFYGSVWPDALPYRVLLNPQLDAGASFTNKAHALGNLVLLDCHPTSREFVGGSAVVFHEMSHTLSTQQRRALQVSLESWYQHNPSPSRRYAYHLLEEALATVAGEWLYAQQAGQPEAGEWYADDYIDRYAKALYPLMTNYVQRGQEIDSAFVAQSIAAFDRTFPQAATDYVNLFRYVLYWTDTDDAQATYLPFQERFRSTFTYSVTPILNQASGLAKAQGGDYLPVILVTRQHAATLRYLRQHLPALRRHRLPAKRSFVLSTTGPAGPLVLVCAHTDAQLARAAELLAKQGRLDPARLFTEL
ncbi:hypothetical protein HHL22_19535 [Hymenobacter sp. RP-2-7]|uniref:DUF4932 domain-containing protein n=1 Tax=Hymenobacter polaris TaxID=2682546 RepID=A0A7Y0AHE2_9BACT|nr:hypothetical protein [Hymenobacter polaris]NML67401.1 hypothetical protein [Hymenobacter polaris]